MTDLIGIVFLVPVLALGVLLIQQPKVCIDWLEHVDAVLLSLEPMPRRRPQPLDSAVVRRAMQVAGVVLTLFTIAKMLGA